MIITDKLVSVIIPAYNEADIIEETLANLDYRWIKEIIVINDGSEDKTLELIKKYIVKIINFRENKGKGRAVEAGLKAARGEVIAIIDADLGESVREISKLIEPIIKKNADIVIGIVEIKGGGLGLVCWLAEKIVDIFTGQVMKAPLSGQRIFHRRILSDIMPLAQGFGLEIAMDIDILNKNINLSEIKCDFAHRVTGHTVDGYFHRWQQFYDIVRTAWFKRRYLWLRFLKKLD